ncbi:helix-turn-helix domain-containing protein [Brucella tritici]|uniref:Helix-turn-helix domain-containing protein n=1 Tax=Brucella tritici TaxID=94626 RepID=A0A833CPJ8_9HYPH|nr:helix-turn-helix domain-containing protein [Brucella tritici]KAB2666569.1 helix-turn-helix domain-containing protein [Brucella tritici]
MTQHTYYTAEELSRVLSVSVPTLARWRVKGTGPKYIKRGGRVLYRDDELQAWEERNTRVATRDTN